MATETPDGSGGTDGDSANDSTVATLVPVTGIRLVKAAVTITDTSGDGLDGAGDTVTYRFAVANTGNLALARVRVSDALVSVASGPIALAVGAIDAGAFTASYVLTQGDVDRGFVQNTATVTADAVIAGGAPYLDASGNPVTLGDVSDTGSDPALAPVANPEAVETPDAAGATDGDPTDDPTVVTIAPFAQVRLVKSAVALDDTNGSGLTDPGDTVRYAFAVTNTGAVALAGVAVTDPLVAVSGGPVDLGIGETASGVFAADYVLTQADIDRGHIQNSATATGGAVTAAGDPILAAGGQPVRATDVSDTGTAPDRSAVTNSEGPRPPTRPVLQTATRPTTRPWSRWR